MGNRGRSAFSVLFPSSPLRLFPSSLLRLFPCSPVPLFPCLAEPVRRIANVNMGPGCHARHRSAKGEKRNALALQVTD